jgi:hypothetical protein
LASPRENNIGVRNDSADHTPGDPALGELGRYFTLKRWP